MLMNGIEIRLRYLWARRTPSCNDVGSLLLPKQKPYGCAVFETKTSLTDANHDVSLVTELTMNLLMDLVETESTFFGVMAGVKQTMAEYFLYERFFLTDLCDCFACDRCF